MYVVAMTKKSGDTIRVNAMKVDRKIGEAFKLFVVQKHGKLRGAFSEEVTNALREYLQQEKGEEMPKTEKEGLNTEVRLAKLEREVFRPRDM